MGNLLRGTQFERPEELEIKQVMNCKLKKTIGALALALSLGTAPTLGQTTGSAPSSAVIQRLTKLYGPVQPVPASLIPGLQKDPLGHLVALQKRFWPAAWVTSTFYDWRTISKYRRHAGLHLGYDIALPLGTPVAAGWGGEVTAVVPWTDTEYGVTVRSPDGTQVTYGHISPLVYAGSQVRAGQVIGKIASDHVDVKMRDSGGRYVPFGEDSRSGATSVAGIPSASKTDRNTILTTWLVAHSALKQAEDDLFLARNASQKWSLEKRTAERKIELLDATLERLSGDDTEGLVSRKKLEELKAERRQAQETLAGVNLRSRATPQKLEQQRNLAGRNLDAVESWARAEGLTWNDALQLAQKAVSPSDEPVSDTSRLTLDGLKLQVEEGAQRLEELEALYQAGGLSQREIEDQRLRQRLLQEEFNLRQKRNSR